MDFSIPQQVHYTNKNRASIQEIADGLVALDSLIRQTPSVLEALFPDYKIESVEIYLDEFRSGSIWEDLVVKFIFGNQKNFDSAIGAAREKLGMEEVMSDPQVLSAIILVMVLSGGLYWLGKRSKNKPEKRAAIEANNNTVIQIGSGMVGLDADEFRALIDNAVQDKNQLAKDAARIVKPAKRDPNGYIEFGDNPGLKITSESVKAMPDYVQDDEPEEIVEDYDGLLLELRAIDLDHTKSGWRVRAPDLSDRRIKLQLDPSVMPDDLFNKRQIRGKVTVVFRSDNAGQKIPRLIFLREVIEDDV
ncbi:hypothetical protein [Marinobacter adhaerens]|jgi:hypothetical protein|uniref:Uncharacterized protein n=2 Tax=Marinobacter adhaerens TaxID=1033846 RepID=A0ABX8INY1_9GAMM|nr:hypothetical protein [Marinobacter adhaerens]ADP96450.1 conserved hypothetical protein [Marinobacter adhaerens HP15]MBW4979559.1 hypothetical protein [Marinobacter adhaerens]QWV14441.1 hypothetical protein KQ249_07565 [Marinobacter adhaerens]